MPLVKIVSLNLHCMAEKNIPSKQQRIAKEIQSLEADIVLLQEVAQSLEAQIVNAPIREDNYALTLQQLLQSAGCDYYLYYRPFKQSFGHYEEGLAFLSKTELNLHAFQRISNTDSFEDWHTRYLYAFDAAFGDTTVCFGNTHFGWTHDNEVFEDQFDRVNKSMPKDRLSILSGDFNVTPVKPEYTHIVGNGWIDLFNVPEFKTSPTHVKASESSNDDMRIDYVMATEQVEVQDRKILFTQQPVSDHYGLFLSINLK